MPKDIDILRGNLHYGMLLLFVVVSTAAADAVMCSPPPMGALLSPPGLVRSPNGSFSLEFFSSIHQLIDLLPSTRTK